MWHIDQSHRTFSWRGSFHASVPIDLENRWWCGIEITRQDLDKHVSAYHSGPHWIFQVAIKTLQFNWQVAGSCFHGYLKSSLFTRHDSQRGPRRHYRDSVSVTKRFFFLTTKWVPGDGRPPHDSWTYTGLAASFCISSLQSLFCLSLARNAMRKATGWLLYKAILLDWRWRRLIGKSRTQIAWLRRLIG